MITAPTVKAAPVAVRRAASGAATDRMGKAVAVEPKVEVARVARGARTIIRDLPETPAHWAMAVTADKVATTRRATAVAVAVVAGAAITVVAVLVAAALRLQAFTAKPAVVVVADRLGPNPPLQTFAHGQAGKTRRVMA